MYAHPVSRAPIDVLSTDENAVPQSPSYLGIVYFKHAIPIFKYTREPISISFSSSLPNKSLFDFDSLYQ